jgi:hypothetical protein
VAGAERSGAPAAPRPAAPKGRGPDFSDLAAAGGAAAAATRGPIDPKALVRGVAQGAGYQIVEQGETWDVTVPVGLLRKQVVRVAFDRKDDEGDPLIAFSSTCGPATDLNAMRMLRYNTQLVHGAFAVVTEGNQDHFAIQANQLATMADPVSISRVLTAVAWQADKVEEKLLGGGDTN